MRSRRTVSAVLEGRGLGKSFYAFSLYDDGADVGNESLVFIKEGGGYLISGGCNFPDETKAENFHAGVPLTVTPWSTKKAEIGEIPGDEKMIRQSWESLESMAYVWFWQWAS